MIWLAWRQHRQELALFAAMLGLLVLGMELLALQYGGATASVSGACTANGPGCGMAMQNFQAEFGIWQRLIELALLVAPLMPGIFIGAPLLAREFEHGTHLLVWTQSRPVGEWLRAKLVILTATVGLAVAVAALVSRSWVLSQPSRAVNEWLSFDTEGAPLIGYCLFALCLGVCAGCLTRRTIPAMVVTIVGYVATRLVVEVWARPGFVTPATWRMGTDAPTLGSVWMLGTQRAIDKAGAPVATPAVQALIASAGNEHVEAVSYLSAHGVYLVQSYQPADRLALFQFTETAIFLVLGSMLVAATWWLLANRD